MKRPYGKYTREEWLARYHRGLDWHEDVRLADLKRIREKIDTCAISELPTSGTRGQDTERDE